MLQLGMTWSLICMSRQADSSIEYLITGKNWIWFHDVEKVKGKINLMLKKSIKTYL